LPRRALSGLAIALLILSSIGAALKIQPARAEGTIYIRADGSIDPPTAPISTADNVTYTLTDDINGSINVERDNIVVDGAGYTVTGSGSGNGTTLTDRSNVTVRNVTIKNFTCGIWLYSSSNNTVSGNNITNSDYNGVIIEHSSYNTFSGNKITNSVVYGVLIEHSSYNTFSRNNITANNDYGILFMHSSYNTVSGNNITNNYWSAWLSGSSNNTFSGNNIIANNDWGIVLMESSGNTMTGNKIADNIGGISLLSSQSNAISENNITNNYSDGIDLSDSSNNTFSGNNITNNNDYGISLFYSSNYNTINGNSIENSTHGIYVYESSNNTIIQNKIKASSFAGFRQESSSRNLIYHNSFVENAEQVSSDESVNAWDYGYPSGGNYWSTYVGVDLYNGPYQNETGQDGIGDTPYVIDENNVDKYPLMGPWTATGDNITVMPSSDLTITFGNVASEGITTANKTATGPEHPPRFKLKEQYYDVETTANYTGIIRLGIAYDSSNMTQEEEQALQLLHWNEPLGEWENITTHVDTENDMIYGETTSLSAFAVFSPFPWDVTGDNYVGIDDIFEVAMHFGAEAGDPNYDQLCDINKDNYIGIDDIFIAAQHFGEENP
jgi:parallel beta-helix repeat protein